VGYREHPVVLSGPGRLGEAGAPALLAFDEADFLRALDELLLSASWPARGWPAHVTRSALGADGAAVRLYQPVHRRFSLALLDAHCLQLGAPKVDPRRIVGSGLVLRRFTGQAHPSTAELADPQQWQGWMGPESDAQGWVSFASQAQFDADPESSGAAAARTGSAVVDALLAARFSRVKAVERTVPLWYVRPEVGAATGRTLLFGLIPTASPVQQRVHAADARAELAALRVEGDARRQAFIDHLSKWFKYNIAVAPPRAGGLFEHSWLTQTRIPDEEDDFIAFIEQLAYEFDAFGENRERWRPVLSQLRMWRFNASLLRPWKYERIETLPFLEACARIVRPELVWQFRSVPPPVAMPHLTGPAPHGFDPTPPPSMEVLLSSVVAAGLDSIEMIAAAQPLPRGPYEDEDARYAVRAFARIKSDEPNCPPRLVWSDPSQNFTIAPWFETTGRPQPAIPLPKLDRATLAKLKPSTGFSLPPRVRGLLNPNGAQAMLAGNPRRSQWGIEWVLQLSMPIMTVCALVAMTVVLTLLDFVFRWIPFAWILLPRLKK